MKKLLVVFYLSVIFFLNGCNVKLDNNHSFKKNHQLPNKDLKGNSVNYYMDELFDLETQIRKDYFSKHVKPIKDDATIDDVSILHYYGLYNNSAVVMMDYKYFMYLMVLGSEEIDGITFLYNNSNRIKVWNNRDFYGLEEAYEKGFLEKEDLINIANQQRRFYPFLYE